MSFVYVRARFTLCALVIALAACGGGSGSFEPLPPAQTPSDFSLPAPQLQSQAQSLASPVSGTIGLFQVFDEFTPNVISPTQAMSDGPRYALTWGARTGMPTSWHANNSGMAVTYYIPQETDAATGEFGSIGHSLTWWKANHPDWILYACNASGTPTTTPAYIPQLPNNVPLDIHNPAVAAYQAHTAGAYAHANGYSALGFDEVLFTNITGEAVGSSYYGCGIYQNGTFVRRYSGRSDPRWTADTVAWAKTMHSLLKTDTTLAPMNLKFVVNHPAANPNNLNEQAILQNVDADLDETGFSDYGSYAESSKAGLFAVTVNWMSYAQSHGASPLVVDKFDQTTPITSKQLEFSIATYLMGNQGTARLFVSNANGYGAEQYHAEYATNFGTPCGAMYGGVSYDRTNPNIYYRRYTNAIVVVNAGSLPKASETAHLPATHAYSDLEHRTVTNPLTVASSDAYVLLTSNGCL